MRGGQPAAAEGQRAVGRVADRVHLAAGPAARDVGRQQPVVEHPPGAKADHRLDEIRRRGQRLIGSRFGGGLGGAGAGCLRGALSGSTTIVRDRPGSVISPTLSVHFGVGMRRALGGIVAAALLAGCGSGNVDEANRYVDAVNRAQTQFTGTMDRLSGRITAGSSSRADTRVLRSFDTAVARVVGDLRDIEPPERVAQLHRRLVGEMDSYGLRVR